jgi:hypothetical protein
MTVPNKILFTGLCCLLISISASSQEIAEKKEGGESNARHHRITVMMMNAHLPKVIEVEGAEKNFLVPAYGFDYDYWFNGKWGAGLHNDLILQQYTIEKIGDEEEVLREYPVSTSLVGLFKPCKHWVFVAGLGMEFEKNKNIGLLDLGVEYGWELPKNWELSLNLKYENKFNAYDSYLFGIGISKVLYSKKR